MVAAVVAVEVDVAVGAEDMEAAVVVHLILDN